MTQDKQVQVGYFNLRKTEYLKLVTRRPKSIRLSFLNTKKKGTTT